MIRTGVPPSQKAVLNVCSGRVHQLLVTMTKTGPIMLSTSPRKNRAAMIPAKLKHKAKLYFSDAIGPHDIETYA
jgi:hypothetical protein